MTVNDYKKLLVGELSKVTDNPEFEAEQLLQLALGVSKNRLILIRETAVNADTENVIRSFLMRRLNREPLQYICGEWEFLGLRMFCGRGCLIPRDETEMLAEYVIKHLPKGGHFIDLCTGSGCISVSVLKNRKDATATGVDISAEALSYARKNAEYHGISEKRLNFICADMNEYIPEKSANMIVSNPPYIKSADIEGLSPEVGYEPYIALDGGIDGLDFYKTIATRYAEHLTADGEIILEVGYDISRDVAALFEAKKFAVSLVKDIYGVERMCVAKK